ncbi:MAG: DNA repair protein RecN [Rhodospirillales bacterium]|nr:DNA repair protein RecN [Rhodospirillales bacterium]
MIRALAIRDVVLIDRLDLSFATGLGVLSGETGAGKSILLDSLGLALGARSEAGLVRQGAAQASVAAVFELPPRHPARALLAEQGLEAEDDQLVLRRAIGADGRTRAFVNDQPASVGLLKRLGESLVEIHGQFESHSLLDSATHQGVLDAFGGLDAKVDAVGQGFAAWAEARTKRLAAEADLKRARAEEEDLRAAVAELTTLDPKPGEEDELAKKRALMMHAEKLAEGVAAAQAALEQNGAVEANLRTAARALERVAAKAEGGLDAAMAALERAAIETAEAVAQIERAATGIDLDPRHLEAVEERLFAMKALARKHGIEVAGLAALRDEMARRLALLEGTGEGLAKLAREEQAARAAYVEAGRALSQARLAAAQKLDRAVAKELPPLKLDKARFETALEALEEGDWNAGGLDRVSFRVATNPGSPPGPIAKIASGGELARFMLALKVVLARTQAVPTLVFDEVDSGIGGAVAAAVGERLKRLAADRQVLVVTHSPQVAALADHHWRVLKADSKGAVVTRVELLDEAARREEVARMLAGAEITDEARAAAARLMAAGA